MTDEMDFTRTTRPTVAQVRQIYENWPGPGNVSARKVEQWFAKVGGKISFKTVTIYKNGGWVDKAVKEPKPPKAPQRRTKASRGQIKGIDPVVNEKLNEQLKADFVERDERITGAPVADPELVARDKDFKDLTGKDEGELVAVQRKDNLIYNIMLLRAAQRRISTLVLIPKDAAALLVAANEAAQSLNHIPAPSMLPQEPMKELNPTRELSVSGSAVAEFRRKMMHGA